jgi:hypothetical protein
MKYIIDKFKADLIRAYLEKCKLYMTNIISAGNPLDQKRVEVYNYVLGLL